MRYHIIMEGAGGELDRREVARHRNIKKAVLDLANEVRWEPGDVLRIVDTKPDDEEK